MGELDKQPENFGASNSQSAEALLRAMTQDIENLRQNLLVQLSQDVERLQREKSLLIEDIEKLQAERQQQIVQQQQLVKQIAPALANQLRELLAQRLHQLTTPSRFPEKDREGQSLSTPINSDADSGFPATSTATDYNENAQRLIASLDSTLRTTFRTLQRDLSSYQSSLSQQIDQMYNLEQQGEAILEALVSRLREELQAESSAIKSPPIAPPAAPKPPPSPNRKPRGYQQNNHNSSTASHPSEQSLPAVPFLAEPEQEPSAAIPQSSPQPQPAAKLIGFLLVLLSSLGLALQNLVISVIFNKSSIFGMFELGGFVAPTLGNSLLILWLRMLVVVPLMAIFVTAQYPSMWRDIKQFALLKDWFLFLQVLGSGFFLFLSQVLIYLALGPISPGVAITIFFIYPIITVLLQWLMFGNRPSLFRSLFIFSVLLGFVLIILPSSGGDFSGLGISAAVGSAIAFALYIILAQTSAKNLNPIPLSWINFVIILAFSGLSLAGPLPASWHFDVAPGMWSGLFLSSLLLAGTTLVSYLLNHIGIIKIGAARASILGITVPSLTALLAWVIIQKPLQEQQFFGMLLVTLGVAALILERLRRQSKTNQPAARKLK